MEKNVSVLFSLLSLFMLGNWSKPSLCSSYFFFFLCYRAFSTTVWELSGSPNNPTFHDWLPCSLKRKSAYFQQPSLTFWHAFFVRPSILSDSPIVKENMHLWFLNQQWSAMSTVTISPVFSLTTLPLLPS